MITADQVYIVPNPIQDFMAERALGLPYGWYMETSTLNRSVLVKNKIGDIQRVIPYEAIEDGAEIEI